MPASSNSSQSTIFILCQVVFDIALAYAGAAISEYIRFQTILHTLSLVVMIQALLAVLFSIFTGVYLPWRGRFLVERVGKVAMAWTLSFAALIAFMAMTKTTGVYSRIWMGVWFLSTLFSTITLRLLLYSFLMRVRSKGRNSKKVMVIGNGKEFEALKQAFAPGNPYGYRLNALIHHKNIPSTTRQVEKLLVQGMKFDECWICLPLTGSDLIKPLLVSLRHTTLDIRYMPGFQDMPLLNYKVTTIGGFNVLDISCTPMDSGNRVVKRLEDLVIGSVILVLISPVFVVIALAVKISSPGPVFFRQKRHGANGEPIEIYKFRSMRVHRESKGQVKQATKNDPRVTKCGAFIRRTSLDELPQFINVIQGRMSVVGPRPHALAHNEYYKDLVQSYMKRHKVKPGITGLAQVRGFRGETDTLDKMQRRVESDLEYINGWSLWQDIKIIAGTAFKGFVNPNAY